VRSIAQRLQAKGDSPAVTQSAKRRVVIIDIDGLPYAIEGEPTILRLVREVPRLAEILGDPLGEGFQRSVVFTEAYAVIPSETFAAQASIFTGTYPGAHGIVGNVWFDRSQQVAKVRSRALSHWFGPLPLVHYMDPCAQLATYGHRQVIGPYDDLLFCDWDSSSPPTVVGMGYANAHLTFKTIYQVAKDAGASAWEAFNQYYLGLSSEEAIQPSDRGDMCRFLAWQFALQGHFDTTQITLERCFDEWRERDPSAPLEDQTLHQFDRAMFRKTVAKLMESPRPPDLLTIYLAGFDAYAHGVGTSRALPYLNRVLTEALEAVVSALQGKDPRWKESTMFVIVTDHGRTESTPEQRSVGKHLGDLVERVLDKAGFDLGREEIVLRRDVYIADNAGIMHVYVRNRSGLLDRPWTEPPRLAEDVFPAAMALVKDEGEAKELRQYIAAILYRPKGPGSGYWELADNWPGKVSLRKNYKRQFELLQRLDSPRSGDILIVFREGYYSKALTTNHGGIWESDLHVPLVVAAPDLVPTVVSEPRWGTVNVAATVAEYLGFTFEGAEPALPILVPALEKGLVVEQPDPVTAPWRLRARFAMANQGTGCPEVRVTVRARDSANKELSLAPERTWQLCRGKIYEYDESFNVPFPGRYEFFITYRMPDNSYRDRFASQQGEARSVVVVGGGPDPAKVFSVRPTISLGLEPSAKAEYRIGDTVRVKMKMTAGQVAAGVGSAPKVSVFVWVDGPGGRRFLTESQGRLVETTSPSPVWKPIVPIDYTWELFSTTVTPSSVAGTYTWNAAMYTSETMSEATLVARATPVTYRILLERGPDPSVTSIRTSLNVYRVGDTMVIYYSTLRGARTDNYDLMLRITSKASGRDYYFYDDASDTNRWIHRTPRPMWTGVPQDGNFQIPSGNMPAIVIEEDTPSGDYTMTAYFSPPGKNTPVGNSAQTQFRLETPTPEGECFIATAAYGSAMASSVGLLREFRERYLLPTGWGREIVRVYGRVGPRAAAAIRLHAGLRKAARVFLWPVVAFAAAALRVGLWPVLIGSALVIAGFLFAIRRASKCARLFLLALILVAAARAADVQGNVVRARPFPIPIPGARVELVETGQAVTADQDGGFQFVKLTAGEYTLKASRPGYITTSVKVPVAASATVVRVVVPLTPVAERVYEYYLPHTAEGGGWWTFFNVLNPGLASADLTMEAFDANGYYLGASAKISRLKINEQLSGSPSDYFGPEIVSKAAWYKLTSSMPLTGFEVFGREKGALAGFPLPGADSNQLYLPHVAEDEQWWTGVSFVCAGTRLSEFHLEARDLTGRVLAEASWPKYLGPGEKTVDVISGYFGWDFPAGIQWVSVRSDSPITGFELFGTRDFQMMAAVPALTKGAKKFYFPHVATTDGWWTGIAMLNTDTRSGALRLTAYGEEGKALAVSRSISLGPGERTVGTAESFFDNWPSGAKYIEAASDAAIVGFGLVGRWAPPLLAGLPALSAAGRQLAFSRAVATSQWETSLGVLNTSETSSQVTLQAFGADGNSLGQAKLSLPPKGYRFASLASLFGKVPSGIAWVKATSDGAPLIGFFKLTRISDGQFIDIPAEPIVGPEAPGWAVVAGLLKDHPELASLASQVEITPVPGKGLRVSWPAEIDAAIQALVGDRLLSGDIIVEIGGMPVRTRGDLWSAYRRFRDVPNVGILVWRQDLGVRGLRVRNPLAEAQR
jgi:hypothetical protein